jgi:polyferredoxin
MDKMGYPRGLVRYTTENAVQGKPSRVLRPRIFIYLFVLLALMTLIGTILTNREPLIGDVLRDRTSLYRVAGAELENSYRLKLSNRTDQALTVAISASGLAGLRVVEPLETFRIEPAESGDFALTLALPLNAADPGMLPVTVTAASPDGDTYQVIETRFYVPSNP